MPVRIESDFLGEREIPNDVYYGVQTLRGIENFKITGLPVSLEPFFVQAFGYVKKAAALANRDLGVLDPKVADAIVQACDRIIAGEFLKRDNVQAALSLMGAQLDLALSQWVEVRAGFAEGQLRVERRPKNLLGFLWLGLADDLAARVSKVRTCPSCGRFFSARGSRCLDCR